MSGKGLLLLVDDEEDIRQNLRDYAEMEGYEVLEAENGEEALRILDQEQPGVVISDIMMPVMDGLELLKRIHTGGNDVPVIIMTAFGTIERAVKAMKLGAADFITKPIDLDMMLQVVKRVLTRAELEQKVKQQEQQMKEDLHLASMIQRCMLPQNLDTPLLSLNLRYEPLIEIGGDYLTAQAYGDDRIGVALYDVTGHGVAASLVATMIHHQLSHIMAKPSPPYEILHQINQFATEKFCVTGIFFTLVIVQIDARQGILTAANAGHPDILVWRAERGAFETIASHTLPVGIQQFPLQESHQTVLPLASGDRILLYTDGFTETRLKNNELLGRKAFMEMIQPWIRLPSPEFLDRTFQETAGRRAGEPTDDLTLVVVDRK